LKVGECQLPEFLGSRQAGENKVRNKLRGRGKYVVLAVIDIGIELSSNVNHFRDCENLLSVNENSVSCLFSFLKAHDQLVSLSFKVLPVLNKPYRGRITKE
jgi:hypothetical protein